MERTFSSLLARWRRADTLYTLVDSSPRSSQDIPRNLEHRHTMANNLNTALNNTTGLPVAGKLESNTPSSASTSQSSLEQVDVGQQGTALAASGLKRIHYRPVDSYEGLHRYDIDFKWSPTEEKRVVRKVKPSAQLMYSSRKCLNTEPLQIDKRICSFVCLMFFALQLGIISILGTGRYVSELIRDQTEAILVRHSLTIFWTISG